MSDKLKEIRRLHRLGFSVLYLRPREKMPIEAGWTKSPNKTWEELKSAFHEEYNIGVRLGEPSLIDGAYLTCLDVDIKTKEARPQALQALAKITGGRAYPEVRSGRGFGSRHLYGLTPKPFKMVTFEKHPDWEIVAYSRGRQTVLPPSIHPITGKAYRWERPIEAVADIPRFEFGKLIEEAERSEPGKKKKSHLGTVLQDFEVETVQLEWLDVADTVKAAIIEGANVIDRSAYLMTAAHALMRAGCGKNEILTILTEPDYFLGECAYEHAQTKSRRRAAEWLWRYTVEKIMREGDPKVLFGAVPIDDDPPALEGEALSAQNAEWGALLGPGPEETGFYSRGKGDIKIPAYDSLMNAFHQEKPFKTVADMKNVFAFNGTHYTDITPIETRAFAESKMSPKPTERIRTEFYHKIIANHVVRRNFFTDTIEGKINFKNGVLDLNESATELLPHSPEYGFQGVLPYDFDPKARCPVFYAWLKEVMLEDRELMMVLQEFMGYIVRGGDYKYHKALWLGGVGRNGKSTFVDLLKALIGPGNFSVTSIKSLMGDKFSSACLDGKMANFSEETSPEELKDSGPFKNLTGDGDLTAQKKFGDLYTFRNKAKLVMTYNQIPDLKDLSAGMLSRPVIIPFRKIIEEGDQDRDIKKKLFAELPGIFNFALRGWFRLEKQEGFTYSVVSQKALTRVKEESCGVFQWAEDHASQIEDAVNVEECRMSASLIYRIYAKEAKYPFRSSEFFRRLQAHPVFKNRAGRTNKRRYYWGVKIT